MRVAGQKGIYSTFLLEEVDLYGVVGEDGSS